MARVFLEYSFLFDPDTTWDSLSSFEKDLADFFAAHGLEAEIIKMVEGQIGGRILWIKKMDIFDKMSLTPPPKPKGPQKALQKMMGGK